MGGDSGKQAVLGKVVAVFWFEGFPVHAQGVSFHDVGVCLEGQKIYLAAYDFFSFGYHLTFGNPQGCFGNCYGKIVYFYSIKLADFYFYKFIKSKDCFSVEQGRNHFVFQAAKAQEGFCKKISASAGRV